MEGEHLSKYVANLQRLIKTYSYCADCEPSILRDRVILGFRDDCCCVASAPLQISAASLKVSFLFCDSLTSRSLINEFLRQSQKLNEDASSFKAEMYALTVYPSF